MNHLAGCTDLFGCAKGCPIPAELERQRLGCSGDKDACNCRRCFEARCHTEAAAVFAAWDYAYDRITALPVVPAGLPHARIVRASWWSRLLAFFKMRRQP